jgi:two-component system, LytTR family, response regulator LytT
MPVCCFTVFFSQLHSVISFSYFLTSYLFRPIPFFESKIFAAHNLKTRQPGRAMNILIVEKDKQDIKKLTRILRLIDPSINIVKVADDLHSALLWVQSNTPPDLVLIKAAQLAGTGIQHHQIRAKLILHTSRYNFSYLALPAQAFLQLRQAGNWKQLSAGSKLTPDPSGTYVPTTIVPSCHGIPALFKNRFFIGKGDKLLAVPEKEIAYFFSAGRFVYFTTFEKNKYLIRYRMDELQQLLSPEQFYRVNRSYIISIKSIEQINAHFGGRFKLQLVPSASEEILVSKKRAAAFKTWLGG